MKYSGMVNRIYSVFLLLFLCAATDTHAQTVADYAVQLEAVVQESPARIRLSWKPLSGATAYAVSRRPKGVSGWGTALYSGTDTFYTDNNVSAGNAYEYRVVKSGGSITAYGYIYAGIGLPPVHYRGTLLLLADSLFTDSCSAEIAQLMHDISGDGWQVIRHDISRTLPHTDVHDLIRNVRQDHPALVSVLLLGHIAVPYSGSGTWAPDGHVNHRGAWAADVYYGVYNGPWTDIYVNTTTASQARNHNIPGDGKWDQTTLSTPVELQVSRIDFHDMPAFGKTEVQLMRSYLNRLHRYKTDSLAIVRRALIDDHFGVFNGEAFAQNGWRNFPPLTGRNKVYQVDFINSLNDSSFQWAYGCGGGSYTSATGIGTTDSFAKKQVNGIFTMLFGSYFGDWDTRNNFLRAPLCSETPALTSCWAGRPHWHLHHMALGGHIGYSLQVTQNNNSASTGYVPGNSPGGVHVALMGDLTLRTDYIQPPGDLAITNIPGQGALLSWTASPDTDVEGYYVYRSDRLYGRYQQVSDLVAATGFSDTAGVTGLWYYMVRPVKKTATPSGTYYNLGIGITDSATVVFPRQLVITSLTDSACDSFDFNGVVYKESGTYTDTFRTASLDSVVILDLTIHEAPEAVVTRHEHVLTAAAAGSYRWIDCDDGYAIIPGANEQTYTPDKTGRYAVVVTGYGCSDTSECHFVEAPASVPGLYAGDGIRIYPNPVRDLVTIKSDQVLEYAAISITNLAGQMLYQQTSQDGTVFLLDMTRFVPGMYLIEVREQKRVIRMKVVKE